MRTLHHRLKGDLVKIHFYERGDSSLFFEWLNEPRQILGIDTETSGLDIYAQGFGCRLVQFGDERTAWVLPARYRDEIRRAVQSIPLIAMHNAPHDLHTLDRCFGLKLEDVHPKVVDTMILAHMHDPRGPEDGGIGLGLKENACAYVDSRAADGQKKLKETFKSRGWTIDEGWNLIEEDDEDYVRYSGLDPIETVHLFNYFWPIVNDNPKLIKFEHKIQRLLALMERRGIKLDIDYTTNLQTKLDATVIENEAKILQTFKDLGTAKLTPRGQRLVIEGIIRAFGGEPHKVLKSGKLAHLFRQTDAKIYENMSSGSNQVVVQSFIAMGETLTETTDSGALSVGSDVLDRLCDVNKAQEPLETREPNPLARLVKDSKRANKWRGAYLDSSLAIKDENDRVHAKILGLKARTGRMAISSPPLQQLPSGDRTIRDCFIADPGNLMISCDYDQVELRILAGLAQEPQMIRAIKNGIDLHSMTAEALFGSGFTPKQRKAAKGASFCVVYGGGANTLSKQIGVTPSQAKEVFDKYHEAFPGIKEYSQFLQGEAMDNNYWITTPLLGRRLPVDENRVYAALNYMIQSTARDIMAQALIRLDKAGLWDYCNLVVHDEIIAQAPKNEAKSVAQAIGKAMTTTFMGVPLSAEGDVIGTRWGDKHA